MIHNVLYQVHRYKDENKFCLPFEWEQGEFTAVQVLEGNVIGQVKMSTKDFSKDSWQVDEKSTCDVLNKIRQHYHNLYQFHLHQSSQAFELDKFFTELQWDLAA